MVKDDGEKARQTFFSHTADYLYSIVNRIKIKVSLEFRVDLS